MGEEGGDGDIPRLNLQVAGGECGTGIVSNITGQDFRHGLMTGFLDSPALLSGVTEQGLVDLGYDLVPEPASAAVRPKGLGLPARRRRG